MALSWRFGLGLLAATLLGACSGELGVAHYPLQPAVSELRVNTGKRSIELRIIDLPLYAESEEISVQAADGTLRNTSENLWADQPERALSLILADNLAQITSATTALEPWPLNERPDLRMEVQVQNLLAGVNGTLNFRGQYFIVSQDEDRETQIAERFDITQPLPGEGFPGLAAANSLAMRELAERIARRLAVR